MTKQELLEMGRSFASLAKTHTGIAEIRGNLLAAELCQSTDFSAIAEAARLYGMALGEAGVYAKLAEDMCQVLDEQSEETTNGPSEPLDGAAR